MTIKLNRWQTFLLGITVAMMAMLLMPRQSFPSVAQQNFTPVPVVPDPIVTGGALQRFERGYALWRMDTRTVYIMYDPSGHGCSGVFETYADTWVEGMPETDPNIPSMNGMVQPSRGIGLVWRNNPNVRNGLGYPFAGETGYTMLFAQNGTRAWFNGEGYDVFRLDGNSWRQIDLGRRDGNCPIQ